PTPRRARTRSASGAASVPVVASPPLCPVASSPVAPVRSASSPVSAPGAESSAAGSPWEASLPVASPSDGPSSAGPPPGASSSAGPPPGASSSAGPSPDVSSSAESPPPASSSLSSSPSPAWPGGDRPARSPLAGVRVGVQPGARLRRSRVGEFEQAVHLDGAARGDLRPDGLVIRGDEPVLGDLRELLGGVDTRAGGGGASV